MKLGLSHGMQVARVGQTRNDWATPRGLVRELDREFHFSIDVCASPLNAVCDRFYTIDDNGLNQSWDGERVWMNPPYSDVAEWMEKANRESSRAELIVALVFARTDTFWFHNYVLGKAEIRFLRGRIKFVGAKHNAPSPSMLVIWR
ncbi:phage N-6-adenine-methyltransferase [bacterium]|nr:phage N-6-adenine-methyltransferase [bacterium]